MAEKDWGETVAVLGGWIFQLSGDKRLAMERVVAKAKGGFVSPKITLGVDVLLHTGRREVLELALVEDGERMSSAALLASAAKDWDATMLLADLDGYIKRTGRREGLGWFVRKKG